jgi:hypothetical protein
VSAEHDKERDDCIASAAECGWRVARITKQGYTIMQCACGEHTETLKKTPRLADHFRKKAKKMVRDCCTG